MQTLDEANRIDASGFRMSGQLMAIGTSTATAAVKARLRRLLQPAAAEI